MSDLQRELREMHREMHERLVSDLQRELREMHERLGRILAGLDRPPPGRRRPPPGERFDFVWTHLLSASYHLQRATHNLGEIHAPNPRPLDPR